ncbi:hypothetical protein EMIT0P171_120117 [Pseudomonas sp. IT-P171]
MHKALLTNRERQTITKQVTNLNPITPDSSYLSVFALFLKYCFTLQFCRDQTLPPQTKMYSVIITPLRAKSLDPGCPNRSHCLTIKPHCHPSSSAQCCGAWSRRAWCFGW